MPSYACAAVIGGLILIGLTGVASAHAKLVSAVPAVNATVSAAPTVLDLSFSESVNVTFTGVTVTGPDKKAVATGSASLANSGATLVVPISGILPPGQYTVSWHALSGDGHKTQGSYVFTLKP